MNLCFIIVMCISLYRGCNILNWFLEWYIYILKLDDLKLLIVLILYKYIIYLLFIKGNLDIKCDKEKIKKINIDYKGKM